MSARTHPRVVGGFVLGAIFLVLSAVVLLSSGSFLQERSRFAVFFPGSVRGLQKGSAVTFRGVKVGQVIEVQAFMTGLAENPIQIEVLCEFFGDVVQVPEGVEDIYEGLSPDESVAKLIEQGARARMMSASLLTGQKYIEIDFMPDEPARLAGIGSRYPELPTTPTAMERIGERFDDLMNKLADVPLDKVVENVETAIRAARELLESPEVKGAFESVQRGTEGLQPTLAEARQTMKAAREMIDSLSEETDGLGADVSQTLAGLRERLARTEKTFQALETTLRGTDDARMDASATIVELEQALKAFRTLAEYIQTHPEAFLQGKEKK